MILIMGEPGSGKTEKLLTISEKNGSVIVVKDKMEAYRLMELMSSQNRTMPPPITYDELLSLHVVGDHRPLLIDNVNDFLQYMAGHRVVDAITFGVEPNTSIDVGKVPVVKVNYRRR